MNYDGLRFDRGAGRQSHDGVCSGRVGRELETGTAANGQVKGRWRQCSDPHPNSAMWIHKL